LISSCLPNKWNTLSSLGVPCPETLKNVEGPRAEQSPGSSSQSLLSLNLITSYTRRKTIAVGSGFGSELSLTSYLPLICGFILLRLRDFFKSGGKSSSKLLSNEGG
jgi:hypothetical protein